MIRHFEEIVEYNDATEMKQDYFNHVKRYGKRGLNAAFPGVVDRDQTLQVIYTYDAATGFGQDLGSEVCRGPEQLPPHIKATYTIQLESENIEEISKVTNEKEKYWPGMNLQHYGVAQSAGKPACAVFIMSNFEESQEDETSMLLDTLAETLDIDPNELKEELGDIGVL